MVFVNILPNLLAVVCSIIAIVLLFQLAYKMRGGYLAKVINYLVAGIFFSVTLHSFVELGTLLGFLDESSLYGVMGVLLSFGSLLFIIAGYFGLKTYK